MGIQVPEELQALGVKGGHVRSECPEQQVLAQLTAITPELARSTHEMTEIRQTVEEMKPVLEDIEAITQDELITRSGFTGT